MFHYKALFTHMEGWMCNVIGQLKPSSHRLDIEVGRYAEIPLGWNLKNTMFVVVVVFMK